VLFTTILTFKLFSINEHTLSDTFLQILLRMCLKLSELRCVLSTHKVSSKYVISSSTLFCSLLSCIINLLIVGIICNIKTCFMSDRRANTKSRLKNVSIAHYCPLESQQGQCLLSGNKLQGKKFWSRKSAKVTCL